MKPIDFSPKPIIWRDDLTIVCDALTPTAMRNFGCSTAARILNEVFEDATAGPAVWQPDVYAEGRSIASGLGISRVIDVGCGNAQKLAHFFGASFRTIGIDFRASIERARSDHPAMDLRECDLTQSSSIQKCFSTIGPSEPTLFILADVIEHLPDPRLTLQMLRCALSWHPANRLILSTPDRSRLEYESEDELPKNVSHVREWSLSELVNLLASSGFAIERYGNTRSNQFDDGYATSALLLKSRGDSYPALLQSYGLISSETLPNTVLITTEFPDLVPSGGIGSFVQDQRNFFGVDHCAVLLVSDHAVDAGLARNKQVLLPTLAGGREFINGIPVEDRALVALEHILFYIPSISSVQFQDYSGIGVRVAQAAAAGMLPPSLVVVTHCHGGCHYLENGMEQWTGPETMGIAEREKVAIEYADVVTFPSRFLRDLYVESGIRPHPDRMQLLPYPYNVPDASPCTYGQIDTIAFVGKRNRMKGFGLFLDCLDGAFLQTAKSAGIKRFLVIGPRVDPGLDESDALTVLKSEFELIELDNLGRDELMLRIRQEATRAVFAMPYLADNAPITILDVALSGGVPACVQAGGVPDLIPADLHSTLMAAPDPQSFSGLLLQLVALSVDDRTAISAKFRDAVRTRNNAVAEFRPSKLQAVDDTRSLTVTVIVPSYNTREEYLSDLVFALNAQSRPPDEVIFSDDASDEEHRHILAECAAKLQVPYRIVRSDVNKGLPATRNLALTHVSTDVVVNIDSDDFPLTNCVRDIVACFEHNSGISVTMPYLQAFNDGDDPHRFRMPDYVYRPIGDGIVLGMLDNLVGHANAGFRTDVLRSVGGWDESTRAMWEDWALYLKLLSRGHRILIQPKSECLYRVRKNSMARTYSHWHAQRRLARNIDGFTRYDAFRLQGWMRSHWRILAEHQAMSAALEGRTAQIAAVSAELEGRNAQIAALSADLEGRNAQIAGLNIQLSRRSIRGVHIVIEYLKRRPALLRVARILARVGWHVLRRVHSWTR
jgi:glycosyltransferase involved in cell wall biosynthesis/SAM-dependent methyltransferase